MKTFNKIATVAFASLCAFFFFPSLKKNVAVEQQAPAVEVSGYVSKEINIKLPSLREFTKKLMEDCKNSAEKSPASKELTLNRIIRAVQTNLEGLEQYAYVGLLCMETRVGKLNKPKSSAGAIGIAQLMPETAKREAERCGYGQIKTEDLYDDELNLLISTCHFKQLVKDHGIAHAPLAYNAGGNAESVKRAKELVPPGNLETAGYGAIQGIILTRYLLEPLTSQVLPKQPSHKKVETPAPVVEEKDETE